MRSIKKLACKMCLYPSKNKKQLIIHLLKKHQHDKNFSVNCIMTNCMYSCRSWLTFKQHCRRMHGITSITADMTMPESESDGEESTDVVGEETQKVDCMLAKYFLTLETEHKVSKSAVNTIATATETMFQDVIGSLKDKLCNKVIDDDIKGVIDEVCNDEAKLNVHGLETSHKRQAFYSKHFHYVASEKVQLGSRYIRGKGNKPKLIQSYAYIVPLKNQLECLLNLPEVWDSFNSPIINTDSTLLCDICDGSYIRNHPLQKKGGKFLQLILYFDDIELQNPLRSSKRYKLSMFYMGLANLNVAHRSKLHNMFLVGIGNSKDLKTFGLDKILSDFTTTVNKLRQGGIEMEIRGCKQIIEGDLIFAICDSPAAAWLGGFKESSAFAWKVCRICNADTNSMKLSFNANDFHERDMNTYKERCDVLENPNMSKQNRDHWSLLYGINSRSPLCSITGFPVTRNLLMDPMHILLEGTTGHVMALFLHRCIIELGLFSLEWLNASIQSYDYSYIDAKNKPIPIQRKELVASQFVKQKAASMLLLCYTLPHILGDVFDDEEDDLYYRHFITMVYIVQLSMCPCVNATTAGDMEQLIMFYCIEYKKLYPLSPVRPKMHFMIHLVHQMLEFGPLRCTNTFRYEAKHGWFKALKVHNFINLPYSLAEKHQLYVANRMSAVDGSYSRKYVYNGDTVADGVLIEMDALQHDMAVALNYVYDGAGDEVVYKTKCMEIDGFKYKDGVCMLLKATDYGSFSFGLLKCMLLVNECKYFVFTKLKTKLYKWKLNAFEVLLQNETVVHNFDKIVNKWPIPVHYNNNNMYITNRYCHIGQYF
jgi:hypothetical protein